MLAELIGGYVLDEKSIAKNLANLQRTFIAHNAKTGEYFAARALFCHKGIYYFFDGQEFDGKKLPKVN